MTRGPPIREQKPEEHLVTRFSTTWLEYSDFSYKGLKVPEGTERQAIMLVLSRKPDEQIVIGDGIIVTVVEIRGDKVRLGIEAPRDVSVHRQEVVVAMRKAEQDRAAQPSAAASETVNSNSPSK